MKDIPGYEGLYAITEDGRVWSYPKTFRLRTFHKKVHFKPGHFIKINPGGNGYPFVSLTKDGKTKTKVLHRLVAKVYVPNPLNKPQVNHIDLNRTNNRPSNLEWVTDSENKLHRINRSGLSSTNFNFAVLNTKDVEEMRELYAKGEVSIVTVAERFGVDPKTARRVIRRQTWARQQ